MDHSQLIYWIGSIFALLFLSAFFSSAETALMAINRYRLRHKARQKKNYLANLILRLLRRPDRLLGLILIGNNFSNILASALATLFAVQLFGEKGVVFSTIILTLIVLVFCEAAPKTLAALFPERVARWVSWPVFILLKIFYPLVWFVNVLSNGLLWLFRINVTAALPDMLSREELSSVVHDSGGGRSKHEYHEMLLGVLELNQVAVNDIFIPKHNIIGIDLDWDTAKLQHMVTASRHDCLPVYQGDINQIKGMLYLRELMPMVLRAGQSVTRELLISILKEPYFIPEKTPLNVQLLNFKQKKRHVALVVDEYGDILGLLTLADILEEIVGEYTTDIAVINRLIQSQGDGSFLVDGALPIREFNRLTGWDLPAKGPRTLGGLIIEYLEAIPRSGTCIMIQNYPIEVMQVKGNRVQVARLFPKRIN